MAAERDPRPQGRAGAPHHGDADADDQADHRRADQRRPPAHHRGHPAATAMQSSRPRTAPGPGRPGACSRWGIAPAYGPACRGASSSRRISGPRSHPLHTARDRSPRSTGVTRSSRHVFPSSRTLFGLVAVGGAIAVGITTHDAGFTALTFIGGLILPRVLGFRGHRHLHGGPCGGRGRDHVLGRLDKRMEVRGTASPMATRPASRRRRAWPAHEVGGPGPPRGPGPAAAPVYDDRSVKTVLVVDDEPEIVRILATTCSAPGSPCLTAADGEAALAAARATGPDLVVLDLGLPGWTGSTSPGRCAATRRCRSSC